MAKKHSNDGSKSEDSSNRKRAAVAAKKPDQARLTRSKNGQFTEGNAGGPGRPPREVEESYLHTLRDICDSDQWAGICQRAVIDAASGDARARDWLSRYLIGISRDSKNGDPAVVIYDVSYD